MSFTLTEINPSSGSARYARITSCESVLIGEEEGERAHIMAVSTRRNELYETKAKSCQKSHGHLYLHLCTAYSIYTFYTVAEHSEKFGIRCVVDRAIPILTVPTVDRIDSPVLSPPPLPRPWEGDFRATTGRSRKSFPGATGKRARL